MPDTNNGCPLCGASIVSIAPTARDAAAAAALFVECVGCGSVFDKAYLLGGASHADNLIYGPHNVQHYVETGFSVQPLANFVATLAVVTPRNPARKPRFLDVGCAFGFSLKLAELAGFSATGIEPSIFGGYGRDMLGCDIRSQFLTANDFETDSFDAVLLSEVIEHVPEPVKMLQIVYALLRPGGCLYFSTPNADVIGDGSEDSILDVLSPGAHLCICSPDGLTRMLALAGIECAAVRFGGGASDRKGAHVLVRKPTPDEAPQHPVFPAQHDGTQLALRYLRHYAGLDAAHPWLRNGARFQLLSTLLYQNLAESQAEINCQLSALMQPFADAPLTEARFQMLERATFAEYLQLLPAYAGELHVMCADRQVAGNPTQAAQTYGMAARLCEIERRFEVMPRDSELARCRIGRLHALLQSGQAEAAHDWLADWRRDAPHIALPDALLEGALLASLARHLNHREVGEALKTLNTFRKESARGKVTRSARVALRQLRRFNPDGAI